MHPTPREVLVSINNQKPRTVLVTGAGGGMAAGINAALAAAGHTVLCADLDRAAAEAAAAAVQDSGGNAAAFGVDVTSEESIEVLRAQTSTEVGPIEALVNAAGVLDRAGLREGDATAFRSVLAINLVGPYAMIRAFAPSMIDHGWGRIVNISSIAGVTGYPYPSYAASKAGLSNLTRSLLADFWGAGITVNAICPGVVDTPMVPDIVREQVPNRIPTQKIIDPLEIGALVVFLLTDGARSINGAEILIDGGATALFELINHERNLPVGGSQGDCGSSEII